jgi:hypothetical protein
VIKNIVIDALWMGEVIRQGLLFASEMDWVNLTESQEKAFLGLVSLVITGIVGMRTASARVIERAGFASVDEMKTVAAHPTAKVTVPDIAPSKD